MTRPVLILRPQPGASETLARAQARGLDAHAFPLFDVHPLEWRSPDPASVDAIILTSANAARHFGDMQRAFARHPVFAVGPATAKAALAAGFEDVTVGDDDAAALAGLILATPHRHLLHVTGEVHRALVVPGADIQKRIAYQMRPIDAGPAFQNVLDADPVVLLHSSMAAERFAAQVSDRKGISIVAISPRTAAAAGAGWRDVEVANHISDDEMLELAARLCEHEMRQNRN